MSMAIITLIMMVVSYFTSKKTGASSSTAALTAAAVGAGTYYVGTQTEWGRNLVDRVSGWFTPEVEGVPLQNDDGTPVVIPEGATVEVDEAGVPRRDANGNVLWKLVDTAGNVLESWGPTGTGAVAQSGRILDIVKDNIWPIVIGGGALLLLLRR